MFHSYQNHRDTAHFISSTFAKHLMILKVFVSPRVLKIEHFLQFIANKKTIGVTIYQ